MTGLRWAAAFAAVLILAACAPSGPPFPQGAKEHGPYIDRTNPGYFVRAVFVKDVTVISIQNMDEAPEPTAGQLEDSRRILRDGAAIGPSSLSAIAREAPRFEAAAFKAAEVPGWCLDGATWSYLPPKSTPLDHPFKIRGTYNSQIGAFIFAGQCK